MFILGHLGIGSKLAAPFDSKRRLPMWALYLGTLLPDLIDKPLYYGLVLITHRHGEELGLISGTRTFGHAALFLILLASIAWIRKSKVFAALSLGVATHLLLDNLGDHLGWPGNYIDAFRYSALIFPLHGPHFPVIPYHTVRQHLWSLMNPYVVGGEIIGGILLIRDFLTRGEARRLRRKHRPAR